MFTLLLNVKHGTVGRGGGGKGGKKIVILGREGAKGTLQEKQVYTEIFKHILGCAHVIALSERLLYSLVFFCNKVINMS